MVGVWVVVWNVIVVGGSGDVIMAIVVSGEERSDVVNVLDRWGAWWGCSSVGDNDGDEGDFGDGGIRIACGVKRLAKRGGWLVRHEDKNLNYFQ